MNAFKQKAFSYPFHKLYIPSCLYITISVKLQVAQKLELLKIHHQSGDNTLGREGEMGMKQQTYCITFKKLKILYYVELESFQICVVS